MKIAVKMRFRLLCIALVVLFVGLNAEDFEIVEAVAGQSVELPCNVTSENEGDKLNVLAWYKNGSRTAIYSRDLRDEAGSSGRSDSSRYRLVEAEGASSLMIVNVRGEDTGYYYCFVDFAASPALKTHVNLLVIEPPQRVWVVHENGSRVATASLGANASRDLGPYYVGDTVNLFCIAYGGKPSAEAAWWSEGRMLKNTSTPVSEHRVRSDVTFGPLRREDHGRLLTCSANNNERSRPLSVDITIDMYLPPELVSLRPASDEGGSATRARAGEPLALQCRVLGARPPPAVVWRLGDGQLYNLEQNITMERSQRLLVSQVSLTLSRDHDESHVTCCATANRRDADFVCAEGLPLTVVYPPILKVNVEGGGHFINNTLSVVKGSNITMTCSYDANPAIYELVWYQEEVMLTEERKTTGSLIQSVLPLNLVSETSAGEYVCAGSNAEGSTTSEPVILDITYPPSCKDETIATYGIGENESINLTCEVAGNPPPLAYRWVMVGQAANVSTLRADMPCTTLESNTSTLVYQRTNETAVNTIFCWGMNNVDAGTLPTAPCTFVVTDETAPRPPGACAAVRRAPGDVTVTCESGHDGGLPQKFMFTVKSIESDEQLLSITNVEPHFIVQEPSEENYKFVIVASNSKGASDPVEINKEDIADETVTVVEPASAVPDITTLALALCGGVLLLALAACGLVLCAAGRGGGGSGSGAREPALHAYNTDESNCETCNDSDDGSEYNVRRTDSFRKAISRYPSRSFDVRRTSSFHSARCMNEAEDEPKPKHSGNCRVHSMQNINRRREMDSLCDHLATHLPADVNYHTVHAPRPVNTFYTIPRKIRHKLASDEASEITQTSDGFSLPPPPDEFGTYRAASRISHREPSKNIAGYATINRKDKDSQKYNSVIISPMNTVGLPTISGAAHNAYSYPSDEQQVNSNPFDTSD